MSWQLFYPFFSLENTALSEWCRERLPMVYGTMAPTATFWKGWTMTRILFVCHGNICRSPMAEFMFKDMTARRGFAEEFEIASAATSTEEIWNGVGNPVYPPAKAELARHGIGCEGKRAVQLKREDYDYYDWLIGMDSMNMRNIERMTGHKDGKIRKLLTFAGENGDVADPWYTGDFGRTWRDIERGLKGFLKYLGFE